MSDGYMPPSKRLDWGTPADLFERLNEKYKFTIDLAASCEKCGTPNALLPRFFCQCRSALTQSWAGEIGFLNPPYGRGMDKWIFKCVEELGRSKVVALLPARTDTRWFHAIHGRPDVEIEFLRGRLRFKGSTAPAPFPSMLVYFGIKDSSLLPRAGG